MIRHKSYPYQPRILHDAYLITHSSGEKWGPRFLILIILIWMLSFVIGFNAALTLSALLGFFAAIVGLRQPAIGLFGIGILCALDAPLRVFLLTGGLLRWNTFNYWLLIVMLLHIPNILRLNHPQMHLLQFFILLLGAELVISVNLEEGVLHLLGIVIIFGLITYFSQASLDKQAWYWMGAITSTLSAVALLAFYLQRSQLPYINPNSLSYFPLTGIFAVSLGLPFASSKRKRVALWIPTFVNLGWVFLSGSRGTLLDATICIFFLILLVEGLSQRVTFIMVGLLLLLAGSSQFTDLQANTLHRLGEFTDPARSLASATSGRSLLNQVGWKIFLAHPFGIGTGGFALTWTNIGGSLTTWRYGVETQAHSAWVKTLAENGFPGFVLLAGYVFSFALIGLRRHRHFLRILGVMVTVTLMVIFISTEFQGKAIWFLASGVMVLLYEKENEVA